MDEEEIQRQLVKFARKSMMRFRLSSLVLVDGRVEAIGGNSIVITHKIKSMKYRSIHAEVSAIGKTLWSPSQKATLFVVRIRRDDSLGNARPCNKCMTYAKKHGIVKVIYSTNEGDFKEEVI